MFNFNAKYSLLYKDGREYARGVYYLHDIKEKYKVVAPAFFPARMLRKKREKELAKSEKSFSHDGRRQSYRNLASGSRSRLREVSQRRRCDPMCEELARALARVIIERRIMRAVSGGLINSFCPPDTGSLCASKPRRAV